MQAKVILGILVLALGLPLGSVAKPLDQKTRFPITPVPGMTTGSTCDEDDPDFVEYRYPSHIAYCERKVDHRTKAAIYDAYNVPVHCRGSYTIDHFIPLALGGDNATINLWPEHKAVKATRQSLELQLFLQLRDGEIDQDTAIAEIEYAKWHPEFSPEQIVDVCYRSALSQDEPQAPARN